MVKKWKFEQVQRDAERTGVPFNASGLEAAWDQRILPVVQEYGGRVSASADLVLSQGAGHIVEAMHGRLHAFTHMTHPDFHRALTCGSEF